jgi:hypothetical protein
LFADSGIASIEHADFDGIERLALVTGKHPIMLSLSQLFRRLTLGSRRRDCIHFRSS